MNHSNPLYSRFQVPLHLMTGKGGVGRTTLTIDLGKAFARKGLKTLIVEPADADGGDSMLGRQLNQEITSNEVKIEPNLYAGQLDCKIGHASFLKSIIPIKRLIDAALNSKPLAHFLNSAPSMYELGLFYHLWQIVDSKKYERIIVDLPATGHTLALTQLPKQLERMIRKGYLVDALK
jgi:anion-transporting  ArsA/GET3 family ATPase